MEATTSPETLNAASVEFLILGAGWTSTFLLPLLEAGSFTYAATTQTGRDKTIKFRFDVDRDNNEAFRTLPYSNTILITFPLRGTGASQKLVHCYEQTHSQKDKNQRAPLFIQLGSTAAWKDQPSNNDATGCGWRNRMSPVDTSNDRVIAEEEILAIGRRAGSNCYTTVLNLAGLHGGARCVRNWVERVAPDKAKLRDKKSLHVIHGLDVARLIVAVHQRPIEANGQRWMVTDGRIYDWWDLTALVDLAKGGDPPCVQSKWVGELMTETGVRGLPRSAEALGRALDSRDVWTTFGLTPVKGRIC